MHKHCRVSIRDREPSRIPVRIMERLKNKSRKVRMFVYERIRLTIPKSSKLYCYVKARKQKNKANFTLECSDKLNHHLKRRLRKYLSLFTCNTLTKTVTIVHCFQLPIAF